MSDLLPADQAVGSVVLLHCIVLLTELCKCVDNDAIHDVEDDKHVDQVEGKVEEKAPA